MDLHSLPGDGGDSHPLLARGVLVEGDDLDGAGLTLWNTVGLLHMRPDQGGNRSNKSN